MKPLSDLARRLYFWARWLEDPAFRRARTLGIDFDLYKRFRGGWLASTGVRTIVDVGANVGQFARMALDARPDALLYAFEPLPDAYAVLCRNLEPWPSARAFNLALGRVDEERTIHRDVFSPSSSILDMDDLHRREFPSTGRTVEEIRVPVRTLDAVAADLRFEEPALLKIDVQGFEEEVLEGARAVLGRFALVLLEVSFQPLYRGSPDFDRIYRRLHQAGLRFDGCLDASFSMDGLPLQADALFRR